MLRPVQFARPIAWSAGDEQIPFSSQAQRAYFYSQLPQLAKEWEAHTPKGIKLPKHKAKATPAEELGKMAHDLAQRSLARKRVERTPTSAQSEAGNYRKGHLTWKGLNITIENPRGSQRSGTSKDGKKWSCRMFGDYGYIKRTEGADGDHVDIFLGSHPDSEKVYVIDQNNADGEFDEHKCVAMVNSEAEAKALYMASYSKDWKGFRAIKEMTLPEFKTWVFSKDEKGPIKSAKVIEKWKDSRHYFVNEKGEPMGKTAGNRCGHTAAQIRQIRDDNRRSHDGNGEAPKAGHTMDRIPRPEIVIGRMGKTAELASGSNSISIGQTQNVGGGSFHETNHKRPEKKTIKESQEHPRLAELLAAKADSDKGDYSSKHRRLQRLMESYPNEFRVDSPNSRYPGITHESNFALHTSHGSIPDSVRRKAAAAPIQPAAEYGYADVRPTDFKTNQSPDELINLWNSRKDLRQNGSQNADAWDRKTIQDGAMNQSFTDALSQVTEQLHGMSAYPAWNTAKAVWNGSISPTEAPKIWRGLHDFGKPPTPPPVKLQWEPHTFEPKASLPISPVAIPPTAPSIPKASSDMNIYQRLGQLAFAKAAAGPALPRNTYRPDPNPTQGQDMANRDISDVVLRSGPSKVPPPAAGYSTAGMGPGVAAGYPQTTPGVMQVHGRQAPPVAALPAPVPQSEIEGRLQAWQRQIAASKAQLQGVQ